MLTEPSRLPLAILPASASRNVDLPAPLGPRIAVTCPRSAWPEMSLSRYTSFLTLTPSFFCFLMTLYDSSLNSNPCPGKFITFSPGTGTGRAGTWPPPPPPPRCFCWWWCWCCPPRALSGASRKLSRLFIRSVRRAGISAAAAAALRASPARSTAWLAYVSARSTRWLAAGLSARSVR